MSPDTEFDLLRYFGIREQQRTEQTQSVLAAMTERERRLVREFAVMGFVQGQRYGDGDTPADSNTVLRVVTGCLSMKDIYPVTNALVAAPDNEDDEES